MARFGEKLTGEGCAVTSLTCRHFFCDLKSYKVCVCVYIYIHIYVRNGTADKAWEQCASFTVFLK